MRVSMISKLAGAFAVAALVSQAIPASGAVVLYDSGGFEQPRFHPGFIEGQDSGKWGPDTTNVAEAAAQVTTFQDNSQGVAVSLLNTPGHGYWWPDASFTPDATNNQVQVSWDMDVYQTNSTTDPYDVKGQPFFGIVAFNQSGDSIAALGIDAFNGAMTVQQDPDSSTEFANLFTDAGNTFHNFRMVLNFTNQNYQVFIDNIQRGGTFDFANPSSDFGDADLAAFNLTNGNANGLAYFDNYVVSAVPEPAGCLILASFGVLARRRRV